tara:strand:- start:1592 stop:2836 length:1245 start_codon:yes stop_codon:yes gene_type:complete
MIKPFKVHNFTVNKNLMPNEEVSRSVEVYADVGAKFTFLILQDGTQKFYNFEDEIFEDGNTPRSNLEVEAINKVFRSNITFPLGGGSYVLKLLLGKNTVTHSGEKVFTEIIEKQSNNATITFKPTSVNTSKFSTLPTSTSTGAVGDSNSVDFNWAISTASTDAGGFGLIISSGSIDALSKAAGAERLYYCSKTKAIGSNPRGDGVDSDLVTVADTTGLVVGMVLYYHKATTAPVNSNGDAVLKVYVTKVDLANKTIGFNKAVAFEDGETMTLRAYGSKSIYLSSGFLFNATGILVDVQQAEIKVRANSSGTTIALANTLGLTGGGTVTYKGFGVNQDGINTVTSVNPDPTGSDGDGSMVVNLGQELELGTTLNFLGDCFISVLLRGSIKVKSHPSVNTDVHFDLDEFITAGSAS